MKIEQEILFKIMIDSLIHKYGLMLTSQQCAEALAISTRILDENRKKEIDVPEYIEPNNKNKKGILYPVQNIVVYQLEKSKQSKKIKNSITLNLGA
ncbi:hypothetical protein CRU98_11260 [Arcobacter sp. CECT 8986]|uniref:hypothetical protein n=1 Tax=Arcobacter sp. CECT 8986 TaxID=2044507 RepID=UPI001009A035|nr:hypothetical protein [Arcobacter sp. CECT 8986]RXJ98088.1 hypothetical protein CRU98_11260 [Arcobacter sp. CECT 8986]